LDFFLLKDSSFLCLSFLCGSLALSLCLSGSSLLRSLLSGSSELSSGSSALLCDSSSLRLVGLYLLCVESLRSSYFLCSLSFADLTILSILLSLPSVETLLSLFLAKCAFCNTAVQVLHEEHTFVRKDSTYSVSRLCAYAYPIECAIEVKDHCSGVGVRVERTDTFDKFAITWRAAVCYYNVVESVVLVTMTSQTNLCCHLDLNKFNVNKVNVLFTRKSVQRYDIFLN